jgi:DNA repair protein RecO (recombination protein O)
MMLDLTKFIGFYPNLTQMKAPFFDLKTGCMGYTKTHPDFLEGKLKDYWINLFGAKFDAIENIRLSKDEKSDLLKYVVRYFQLHLQQFKPPKSTEILHEVFK